MTRLNGLRLLSALMLVISSAPTRTTTTSAFSLSRLISSVRTRTQTTNTNQETVVLTPILFDRADSQLFYTNGVEGSDDAVLATSSHQQAIFSTTTATATSSTMSPSLSSTGNSNAAAVLVNPNHRSLTTTKIRPMDLPRRSPPKDVLERQRLLLDVELSVGRVAMVAAVILMGGEMVTGLSMMTQVTEVLH